MPLTAKLSKEFYDKFGNAVVDELVNWFNQVDATYKLELRDLNELNFARFDAKLEQRIAELRAELPPSSPHSKRSCALRSPRSKVASWHGWVWSKAGSARSRVGSCGGCFC